jgi:hypothetical protein
VCVREREREKCCEEILNFVTLFITMASLRSICTPLARRAVLLRSTRIAGTARKETVRKRTIDPFEVIRLAVRELTSD